MQFPIQNQPNPQGQVQIQNMHAVMYCVVYREAAIKLP